MNDIVEFNENEIRGYGFTNLRLQINGLVDENNNLIMDKEKFFKITGLQFSKITIF